MAQIVTNILLTRKLNKSSYKRGWSLPVYFCVNAHVCGQHNSRPLHAAKVPLDMQKVKVNRIVYSC